MNINNDKGTIAIGMAVTMTVELRLTGGMAITVTVTTVGMRVTERICVGIASGRTGITNRIIINSNNNNRNCYKNSTNKVTSRRNKLLAQYL